MVHLSREKREDLDRRPARMSATSPKDILERAERFAVGRHEGQFRRDGVTPYVMHPKSVMAIVRDEFGVKDPGVLAAALLHDTIEDTRTDYDDLREHFGKRVADLVSVLTKDKRLPEARREREYFARLARASRDAKLCKVGDTLHNLRDTDEAHRPKALRKGRTLLRIFRGAPGLGKALDLLRKEAAR
jgi:(p)ppGpp synthase/HD superfamily hydrolase